MKEGRKKATIDVEVRYAETDQMGIVHHANYLVWFELARTRLCTLSGFHYSELEARGYYLMVVAAHVRYRRGAKYGDHVEVSTWIDRLASRGLHFAYEVRRGSELLASGITEHLWVEASSGRPCRAPELIREPFAALAGAQGRSRKSSCVPDLGAPEGPHPRRSSMNARAADALQLAAALSSAEGL